MRQLTGIASLTYLLSAEGMAGIRPRDNSADYPAHETTGGVTVGAMVVPPEQAGKIFATDARRETARCGHGLAREEQDSR